MATSTKASYRAAIIGTGRIASILEKDPLRGKPHTHAGWYSHCTQTELVAGADINAERLTEFGQDWQIGSDHLYEDYSIMLHREAVDIVSVCAYAQERYAMTLHALEAGVRGLWLEKAIGCSLAEAEGMAQAIQQAGAKAIVDYPRRSAGLYQAVKSIIDTEKLGKLLSIQVSMNSQIIHTGTHAFDILRYWCGEPSVLLGWFKQDESEVSREVIQDCSGHGHIVFENGVHVSVAAGLRKYYIFQFDLQFEKGRIQIGNDVLQMFTPQNSLNYSNFKELFLDEAETQALELPAGKPLLEDLVSTLQEPAQEPLYSVDNAVEALRMGIGLVQSSIEGHRQLCPEEVNPELRVESV